MLWVTKGRNYKRPRQPHRILPGPAGITIAAYMPKDAQPVKTPYSNLLGGISAAEFLAKYWQKKPYLIRSALPEFKALLSKQAVLEAACSDDVESRLVWRKGKHWNMRRGPFSMQDFRRMKDAWTVLVQGVNLFLPEGDQLLRRFNFVPYARLDDLMVSCAVDGAGVGPHFDNYDVFLLQGEGRRRWRIGPQRDETLVENTSLKILKNFKPTHEWVLEPGDMLYLPPQWAHDGIAIGDCQTYSIGFRAAPAQELATGFLNHLQDMLQLDGRYRDPDLKVQRHAAEISPAMVDQMATLLAKIRWNRQTIRDFAGCYLTEPKPHIFFDRPARPLSRLRFDAAVAKRGIKLDPRSQLLFSGNHFFLNGEKTNPIQGITRGTMKELADCRELPAFPPNDRAGLDRIYEWYQLGFVQLR